MPEEVSVLPATSWLASLTEEERQHFSSFGDVISCEPKQFLIRQGEEQPFIFYILQGMLSIRSGDAVVAVVGAGEFLGEMHIASSGVASATVITLEPCQVWRMDHETLMSYIQQNQQTGIKILLALLSTVSERLYAVNADLADLLNERRNKA